MSWGNKLDSAKRFQSVTPSPHSSEEYQRGDDVMMFDGTLCRIWDLPPQYKGCVTVLKWVPDPQRPGEPNSLRCVHLSVFISEGCVPLSHICRRVEIRAIARQSIEMSEDDTTETRSQLIDTLDGCWQCYLTKRATTYICRGTVDEAGVRTDFVDPKLLVDTACQHSCGRQSSQLGSESNPIQQTS
eukprot:PhF_6_TR31390/c0_g1_i3/m.45976